MAGSAFLVSLLDFARSFEGKPWGATPESIAAWLKLNWLLKRGGGSWNYDPAMSVLVLAFAGQITLDQAIEHCHKYWHPHARLENEKVVRSFWKHATENSSKVYKRPALAAPVGRWKDRNIYIAVKAPLIRVTPHEMMAVMPIFRKRYVPDDVETNISLTAVREFCFREGYPNLDVELIRAKGLDGSLERQLIVDRGSKRKLYSADEFDAMVTVYSKGVALLAGDGYGLQKPNFKGYRIWDPDEPSFPGF